MTRHSAWRVHGLSVEGYRHRRDGLPCQDAWGSEVTGPANSPVVVLAVADGAGSRPRSDEGSRLAVTLATRHFGRRASAGAVVRPGAEVHELLREAFGEVRREFFRETGGEVDDYATTLTVVVLTPAWLGHLSVGDGFVIVRAGRDGGGERLFHLLPRSEEVSEYGNETVFLTSAEAQRWVRTSCVADDGIDGVLLSTDGLAQAALARTGLTPNASFASTVFGALDSPTRDPAEDEAALARLLRSDRLAALNADDKTLLRAVRT
jgi:hypothetical protein